MGSALLPSLQTRSHGRGKMDTGALTKKLYTCSRCLAQLTVFTTLRRLAVLRENLPPRLRRRPWRFLPLLPRLRLGRPRDSVPPLVTASRAAVAAVTAGSPP